jgi:hypothetical protein
MILSPIIPIVDPLENVIMHSPDLTHAYVLALVVMATAVMLTAIIISLTGGLHEQQPIAIEIEREAGNRLSD